MLDENFIVSIYAFVMKMKCKLGIHGWMRTDTVGEYSVAASTVWDDAQCIEFYECEDCQKKKMVWEDFWGLRHTVKLNDNIHQ